MEHFREPIKRGIWVGTTQALDERADRVVVRIPVCVIDDRFLLNAFFDRRKRQVDQAVRIRGSGASSNLERIETFSSVPIAHGCQMPGGRVLQEE